MLAALAADLRKTPLLVVTGAGISHASGIPTFRGSDPDAVWHKSVTTMGTRGYFERDPVGCWRWYLDRFAILHGKEPNPAHHALVALEKLADASGRSFLLVTQNIDTLHEKAGASALVKVHGSSDRVRCSRDGCSHGAPRGSLPSPAEALDAFHAAPSEERLPRCPACGSLLRPHVLWFDESYTEHADYQFARAHGAAQRCEAALFVGTSFAVGITDLVLEACRGRAPVWSIDPSGRAPRGVQVVAAKAEEVLPEVVAMLAG